MLFRKHIWQKGPTVYLYVWLEIYQTKYIFTLYGGSHSVNIFLVSFGRLLSPPPPPAMISMACCLTAQVNDLVVKKLVGTADF